MVAQTTVDAEVFFASIPMLKNSAVTADLSSTVRSAPTADTNSATSPSMPSIRCSDQEHRAARPRAR